MPKESTEFYKTSVDILRLSDSEIGNDFGVLTKIRKALGVSGYFEFVTLIEALHGGQKTKS